MALIPEDPKQRNALVLGILAAAALYFFWTYWYTPARTDVDEMSARLEQLEAENRRAQIIATRGGTELRERLEEYERHVHQLEALIPQQEEVSALLNDVTTVARQTGVELAVLRPETDEVGPHYTKKSYELDLIGDYHDLGRYLASIASLPRIITPVNLEVTRFQGNQSVLDMEAPAQASLQIQTYILPSGPPADAGAEQQPGG